MNNPRFTDDVVLINKNRKELGKIARELMEESERVGLRINVVKTQYMTKEEGGEMNVYGKTIEKLQDCEYLGQIISFADRSKKSWQRGKEMHGRTIGA